jgi:hypothetical protein
MAPGELPHESAVSPLQAIAPRAPTANATTSLPVMRTDQIDYAASTSSSPMDGGSSVLI